MTPPHMARSPRGGRPRVARQSERADDGGDDSARREPDLPPTIRWAAARAGGRPFNGPFPRYHFFSPSLPRKNSRVLPGVIVAAPHIPPGSPDFVPSGANADRQATSPLPQEKNSHPIRQRGGRFTDARGSSVRSVGRPGDGIP
jgi:hypothetical protein